MPKSTCVRDDCPDAPTRIKDPDTGAYLVCGKHYQQWWKDRKRNGEGALTEPHVDVPCRCGCGKTIPVTGARRRAYEDSGKRPYASTECQMKHSRVTVNCAGDSPDCVKTMEKYRTQVEKNKTGRFICESCRKAGVGCKPRKGEERKCAGCPATFYVRPGDKNGKFHSRACRTKYEQEQLNVKLICPVDGVEFEVWKSHADRGRIHCSPECRAIGIIKNAVPGQWYNGKPKRYHKGKEGYILIWEPTHPVNYHGWVFEHRRVVERAIDRYLTSEEEIDHINEVKGDNRLENLRILDKVAHQAVTVANAKVNRARDRAELEEYRRRFGLLSGEGVGV